MDIKKMWDSLSGYEQTELKEYILSFDKSKTRLDVFISENKHKMSTRLRNAMLNHLFYLKNQDSIIPYVEDIDENDVRRLRNIGYETMNEYRTLVGELL